MATIVRLCQAICSRRPQVDAKTDCEGFFCFVAMTPSSININHVSESGPKISGKVAVVTGASAGIGKAIALALGREGVKCALGARRGDVLEEVVQEIERGGGSAIGVQTDVTSREQVRNLVGKAEEAFGPVDILINNAGVFCITLMRNLKEDVWENTIDVNCKGVMYGIGAVLGGMVDRRSGHIINISSDSARQVHPGFAVYAGTKHFLEGMTQCLRKEVSGLGVKVTSIQPGMVQTPGLVGLDPEAVAKIFNPSPDTVMLQGEDIAQAVVYALKQPDRVGVNEILIHPKGQGAFERSTKAS